MKTSEAITIVHTEHGMCLTSREFDSWRDVQGAFEDYKASLGPFAIDELVEYLRIEYRDAPFDLWAVRGLASRPGTCSWALTESRPIGDGLTLGSTDGDSLRLAIDGFQFPDAEDLNKRFSWYFVDGNATQSGRSWQFRWQALTCSTAPLICGWLFDLANWVERGPSAEPPDAPWLVEPNVQFTNVEWEHGRALITVELSQEFSPPANRAQPADKHAVLRIRSTAEELRSSAIDFAATIARFPIAPGPSRPVKH